MMSDDFDDDYDERGKLSDRKRMKDEGKGDRGYFFGSGRFHSKISNFVFKINLKHSNILKFSTADHDQKPYYR